MPHYPATVTLWRCMTCGHVASLEGVLTQHVTRSKRCTNARIVSGTFEVCFVDEVPSVDPAPALSRGPKPRDYDGYFSDKVPVDDYGSRLAYLTESRQDIVRKLRALPWGDAWTIPSLLFRVLWGEEAPERLQSIVLASQTFVARTCAGIDSITKREQCMQQMAIDIFTNVFEEIPGLRDGLRDVAARVVAAVESRGKVVIEEGAADELPAKKEHPDSDDLDFNDSEEEERQYVRALFDKTMTLMRREFQLLPPASRVPKKQH